VKKVDKERCKTLLKQIIDHIDLEDRASRERQLRVWRRLKLLWEGYSRTWYSETAHDWRVWDEQDQSNTDQEYYDKPINIFRAYLESIIAALSVLVPPIKCYPDDADNPLDIATAKAGDKVAQLIYRHNDVTLLWIHALFVYCTEGMVSCYHRPECDKEYGQYQEKEFEDVDETHQTLTCPKCQNIIDDITLEEGDKPEKVSQTTCPSCNNEVTPISEVSEITVEKFKQVLNSDKARIIMECYGGLNVKTSNWARSQKDLPYLQYAYETHYANSINKFEDLRDDEDFKKLIGAKSPGAYDQYDQWARLSPQYQGEYPINVVTEKYTWIRPALYNILVADEDVNYLKKKFPTGVKVSMVNSIIAEFCECCLDDEWTVLYNPLSNYLQDDPIALLITSTQEIVNDLVSLIQQTIEHGIGQTFVDPAVLNLKAYASTESTPGGMYPIKQGSLGGKSIGDAFFETRTATLSQEVIPFLSAIQSMGQQVIGALPSLWGGQIESKTASVYSMSRSQALQRLGNIWKMLLIWWKNIHNKTIPMYMNTIKEDEHDVRQTEDGNFINVFIRMAELEGKIGKVELEANENLPISWNQVRDSIMQLLQSSNPKIMEIFCSSENLEIIREAIGLTDLYVPGEDDRNKQYEEIKLLLQSTPLTDSEPSVPIDPIYDNHVIEFEIVRKWVTSEEGRLAKITNAQGYKNVLLHGYQHQQEIQQSMQPQPPAGGPPQPNKQGNVPPAQPNPNVAREAPIMGDQHVSTVQ